MSFPGGITLAEAISTVGGTITNSLIIGAAVSTSGNASGALITLRPSRPVAIIRWGIIATTTVNDGTNALKVTLDWHPTVGSASSAVVGATTTLQSQTGWNASSLPAFFTDTAGGSMTFVASASQLAAGKGAYHQINPQTKMPPNDSSTNPVPSPDTAFVPGGGEVSHGFTVYPGQEAQMSLGSATQPTAGAIIPFIHYIPLAFQASGSNYENVASGIPSSITPVVGDPGIWTRFTS